MNIYESMAHTLLSEHGRELFTGRNSNYSSYTMKLSAFWELALMAYGSNFYELPKRLGLPTRNDNKYSFPAYQIDKVMPLGISPTEALFYPSMGNYQHQYTPIHLASAMLSFCRYEPDIKAEAEEMLKIGFMKRLWGEKGRKADDFASSAVPNPCRPEDFGKKPYDLEQLKTTSSDDFYYLDELGNMFWFPREYVEAATKNVSVDMWLSRFTQLSRYHGRWGDVVESWSYRKLVNLPFGKSNSYSQIARYLRQVSATNARAYYRSVAGTVGGVTTIFRADATAEEMGLGLRMLANSKSSNMEASYSFIGRELTYEDVKGLRAPQLLTIINNVHWDVIRRLVDNNHEELCSILFTLPAERYTAAMSCLQEPKLPRRGGKWFPDTEEGNLGLSMGSSETVRVAWERTMKPLAERYATMRRWRNRLLDLADPNVAFLALMCWRTTKEDPVPHTAIENVLRSVPEAMAIQEHLLAYPTPTPAVAAK